MISRAPTTASWGACWDKLVNVPEFSKLHQGNSARSRGVQVN